METKYKTIPFDVNRINEEGVQVVTRDGRSARILCTDLKDIKPIVAAILDGECEDFVLLYHADGYMCAGGESDVDLFLKIKVKARRMTKQELSWWLRNNPEEHREYCCLDRSAIHSSFDYTKDNCNDEVPDDYRIRSNGGEWEEPLVEEIDYEL